MIPVFFIQLLWSLAIIGLGSFVLKALFPKYFTKIVPEKCLIGGCFAIVLFAQIYHLFFKITPAFSGMLLFLGLVCFFRDQFLRKDRFLYISLIIVSFWVAPYVVGPMNIFDSGLYHIQSILWHLEGPLVKGLANVHRSLGFNSSFSLFAGILFPFKDAPQGFPLANGVLANIILLPLIRTLYEIGKKQKISVSSMYLLASSLYVLERLSTLSGNPATDLPIFILAITSFYFLLQYIEIGEVGSLIIFSLGIALGVTFKLSLAPYALFVLFFTVRHFAKNKSDQKPLWLLCSCMALLGAIWMYRFYIMSGCWIFPVASTCTASHKYWSVSVEEVTNVYSWIKSWARIPGVHPSHEVFDEFRWFSLWFENNVYLNYTTFVFFSIISFAYLAVRSIYRDVSLRIFIVMHTTAVCYWFFTAPDMRFGSFYMMSISAHAISDLLGNVLRNQAAQKFLLVVGSVVVITLGGLFHFRVFFGKKSYPKLFLSKNFHDIATVDYFEANGVTFKHPKEGEQCWDAPVPCTIRNEGTFYVEKKDGVITLISKRVPTK